MKTWILKEFREDARKWWYHVDLRARGQHAEAAKHERRSIISHMGPIRQALTHGVEYVAYWTADDGQKRVNGVAFRDPHQTHAERMATGGYRFTSALSGMHPGSGRVWLALAERCGWAMYDIDTRVTTPARDLAQPALPGAESVRETETATPSFAAPFALQAAVQPARPGKQGGLFDE